MKLTAVREERVPGNTRQTPSRLTEPLSQPQPPPSVAD
jgi:hypothetical protein